MDITEIRAIAQEIVERAKTDETFRQQLRNNPRAILAATGLPEQGINDFIGEAALEGYVAGYVDCRVSIDTVIQILVSAQSLCTACPN